MKLTQSDQQSKPPPTPIKFTQMQTSGRTDIRFSGQSVAGLSKTANMHGLIPITSPLATKFLTAPAILKK